MYKYLEDNIFGLSPLDDIGGILAQIEAVWSPNVQMYSPYWTGLHAQWTKMRKKIQF